MVSTRDRRVAARSPVFYAKDTRKEILQKEGGGQVFRVHTRAIFGQRRISHNVLIYIGCSCDPVRLDRRAPIFMASFFPGQPGQMLVRWLRASLTRALWHGTDLAIERVTREFPLHEREVNSWEVEESRDSSGGESYWAPDEDGAC